MELPRWFQISLADLGRGLVRGWPPVRPVLLSFLMGAILPIQGCGQLSRPAANSEGILLGRVSIKNFDEISGAVASRQNPGVLWAHEDGSPDRLIALSTNGNLLASFKLKAKIEDLEDIALGPGPEQRKDYLYLGDIGDNKGARRSIRVYRFPEPAVQSSAATSPGEGDTIRTAEHWDFSYPDGPHDAEALFVDPRTGDIFIATKQRKQCRVYMAKKSDLRENVILPLILIARLDFSQVSAADISSEGDQILFRRENAARLWLRDENASVADALSGRPRAVPVIGPPAEPNGEAVTFHPDGKGYYTLSEGKPAPLYFFPLPGKEG